MKWYRKAAEQGDPEAQFNLGVMYYEGEGMPQSDVKAARWYRKAAEQGHAIAQFRLGYMYFYGRGVPEDHIKAYAWWSFAGMGYEDFRELRDKLRELPTAE